MLTKTHFISLAFLCILSSCNKENTLSSLEGTYIGESRNIYQRPELDFDTVSQELIDIYVIEHNLCH